MIHDSWTKIDIHYLYHNFAFFLFFLPVVIQKCLSLHACDRVRAQPCVCRLKDYRSHAYLLPTRHILNSQTKICMNEQKKILFFIFLFVPSLACSLILGCLAFCHFVQVHSAHRPFKLLKNKRILWKIIIFETQGKMANYSGNETTAVWYGHEVYFFFLYLFFLIHDVYRRRGAFIGCLVCVQHYEMQYQSSLTGIDFFFSSAFFLLG